jgi:hypothetical protein
MARPARNGGRYSVYCSAVIARRLKQIHKRAIEQGRGEAVLSAVRAVWHELSYDPVEFGEPLYRLPALQVQIRLGFLGPLLIDYAVHDSKPLVFIKGVMLLPKPAV